MQCPFEYPGVFAEAGPQEFAPVAAAEPIDVEDLRQQLGVGPGAQVEPVLQVVNDVIAEERAHRHRVAAHDTDGSGGGGGGFRGQGRGEKHPVLPVEGLGNQRDGGRAATAEEDRRDWHPGRVVPFGREGRALPDRGAKARVGVRGGLARAWGPVAAFPVGEMAGWVLGHAFPPDVAVIGECDVGEDRVPAFDGGHRVRVGVRAGAGGDAEESGFGVDSVQPPVVAESHPGDVIADGFGGPSLEGGLQHREVCFATGRGEGGGDVAHLVVGAGEFQDEHVLGQPTLVAGDLRRDPQGIAFLAEQRVAAVAGAVAPDGALLGEVGDVLGVVARPRHVGLPGPQGCTDAVQAADEVGVAAEVVPHRGAGAGHDLHADHHVFRVGDLHAVFGFGSVEGTHAERDHVHGAPGHRPAIVLGHHGFHVDRVDPIVRGAGVGPLLRADEGAVLDARHVLGVRGAPE